MSDAAAAIEHFARHPVMRYGIRSDQQLEAIHALGKGGHHGADHARAELRLGIMRGLFRRADQECAGAAGRIEQADVAVEQAVGIEVASQSAIRFGNNQLHDFWRSIIDAVFGDVFRIEDPQEVFIQIQHRIATARRQEHFRIDRIDRIDGDIEGNAKHVAHFVHRQGAKRSAQQRVGFFGKMAIGLVIDLSAAARIARQQQAEDQGLREGSGKQLVHVAHIVATGFGAGI